jgi:hypothetical protein
MYGSINFNQLAGLAWGTWIKSEIRAEPPTLNFFVSIGRSDRRVRASVVVIQAPNEGVAPTRRCRAAATRHWRRVEAPKLAEYPGL